MTREWFLDTDRERVRLALPAEPMPSIFVRAALDRWLQDPAALRSLVSMAEHVAPERDHRTHIDDAEGIRRLRETLVTAFARGALVVEAMETVAAVLASAPKSSGASPGKSAKSGATPTGAKSKSGPTSGDDGAAGTSPNSLEDPIGWFEVTVVDAWGEPIGDLPLEISYAGTRKRLTTPSSGRVRLEKVDASFGSARILDVPAARDLVRPRFLKKPPPAPPAVPNPTRVALTDDLDTVPLTSEVPKTIVVVKSLTRVRLLGTHFDTNKSFMRKSAVPGLQRVYREYQKLGTGSLLVVGHTDTVADESYNLDLSLERAEAVKAYLRDDVPAWEAWFDDDRPQKKRWGSSEIAHMISAFPCEQTVAGFQTFSNGARETSLKIDGKAGPQTRHALIEAYMALPDTSLPKTIGIEIHGLGEFFPATEDKSDNLESEENRRVEMFCFDDAIHPPVPGKKGKKGEPEYPQWKTQVTETVDVDGEDDVPPLLLTLTAAEGSRPRLLAINENEHVVLALDESHAERVGTSLTFEIDKANLPSPVHFVAETWGVQFPHGVSFLPTALVAPLKNHDAAALARVIYGDAPSLTASSGAVLAAAPTTTTVTDRLKVRITVSDGVNPSNLEVDVPRPAPKGGGTFIHTNKLIGLLQVTLDGTPSSPRVKDVVGDFALSLPAKTSYVLEVRLDDADPDGAPLVVKQEIVFHLTSKGWVADTPNVHPRITGLSPAIASAKTNEFTLSLDVSFIGVTKRTARVNKAYREAQLLGFFADNDALENQTEHATSIHRTINEVASVAATTRVREDPRKGDQSPTVWLIVGPNKGVFKKKKVDVFLYFQNEATDHTSADRHGFGNVTRIVTGPGVFKAGAAQGSYGTALVPDDNVRAVPKPDGTVDTIRKSFHDTTGYASYPGCGWAAQLEASGTDVLMVMPNVVPGGNGMSFGDLALADTGIPRIERLLFMLWADQKDRSGDPPELRRLILGGWSSGMNTVFQWFQFDAGNRVDSIFCFDATGAEFETKDDKPSFPPLGRPQPFPQGPHWEAWLKKTPNAKPQLSSRKGDRFVAFVNGGYSQERAIGAASHLGKAGLGGRLVLHEPSSEGFWFDDLDYRKAHHSADFPSTITPNQVCVHKETGAHTTADYKLFLCHGSSESTTIRVLSGISRHEAADFFFNALGAGIGHDGTNSGVTVTEYDLAIGRPITKVGGVKTLPSAPHHQLSLLNTVDLNESDRALKERHTWSVSGGMTTPGGFKGYLQLCLERARAAGFL